MGNTPSHQHGHGHEHGGAGGGKGNDHLQIGYDDLISPSPTPTSTHHTHSHGHRHHPNLRLPMPARPTHISPSSSNPTSPSGSNHRSGSPRRRKSLELPDLNKLSFTPSALTPAAPVPTTHTHTSHHLAPSTSAVKNTSPTPQAPVTPTPATGTSQKKWQQVLGGRTASPLANANALGAMSRIDNPPRSAPIAMPNTNLHSRPPQAEDNNPYFPTTAAQDAAAKKSIPIPIPGKEARSTVTGQTGLSPPPPTKAPTPLPPPATAESQQPIQPTDDGMVNVPIHWTGGGKNVYVTGNFADNWKGRIKLHRSTHDFNTILRLPPGQYRLKFIVDDSWMCSKLISTATDDDGTLVNWIEVETPKTEEEMRAEWAMDAKPAVKEENDDESQWTTTIPPSLTLYQYIEELPNHFSPEEYSLFLKSVPYLPNVPAPPTLPRILDKVIVNNDSKRLWDSHDPSMANQVGYSGAPATLDDNSILAVPNHVVLNHLTASAIRNGTLGVGTTTRYRKKYITTMFFKPTLSDMPGTVPTTEPPTQSQSEADSVSVSQPQSVQ
ncbi:hypothetical protein I302_100883 [Kwoniella bestiolae CBS 10118]|uniref:Association with the SNF1 complex (ASC) domain-containing protein n=1 Tax=Kwoniella bestiolae CBS 10118 TaxID=1296100 RepID=A0A1B9G6E2_9TREE|nr:hypothetical protein I302_04257 [Kwoniella bestiolae CBS 10118]OCF26571.1 hypothetical protein I302_04257 [Kwoniella bestiolae CBS 10118]